MLVRLRICTIPLAFRRASVCVCLYGFVSALSLAQHHVLASLVKGRWLDGKAQALILLLSVYDTSAFLFTKLFCRQDVGIVTPPTFPKPHYPTRIPYCNRLYALICFRIGTIPLAFCRVSVCVCLVGFASLQSPWAHTLRHPCLARPSRCTNPCCFH